MKSRLCLLVAVLAVALHASLWAHAAPAGDYARYVALGGLEAAGRVDGTCIAAAAAFDPSAGFAWHALVPSVNVRIVDTWVNESRILDPTGRPIQVLMDADQSERSYTASNVEVRVEWKGNGRLLALPAEAMDERSDPFVVALAADGVEFGLLGNTLPVGSFWVSRGGEAVQILDLATGWHRAGTLRGAALSLSDGASLYLEDSTIRLGSSVLNLGPYESSNVRRVGDAEDRTTHYVFGLLQFPGMSLDIPAFTGRLWCGAVDFHIVGSASIHEATGSAQLESRVITFVDRELGLNGTFSILETIKGPEQGEPSTAQAVGEGHGKFGAIGVDFVPISLAKVAAPRSPSIVVVGIGVAGVAALVAAWFLFARVQKTNLLTQDRRKGISDIIQAEPGITFADLCDKASLDPSTARYHLRLLERHGKAMAVKFRGRLFYVPPNADGAQLVGRVFWKLDPKVLGVLAFLEAGPLRAREVADGLQRRWNLSRSGSWRVIDRACRADLVQKSWAGGELVLTRASQSPQPSSQP